MFKTAALNAAWQHSPINPFEENNHYTLQQSILSPNLFNTTTNLSTPKDTNNMWNIDQRAILFPANIPTDEKSMIAQFLHDAKLNRQVNAAVEAFWSRNKTIIETPALRQTTSLFKRRIKRTTMSNNTTEILMYNESHETSFTEDQTCQTAVSSDVDMNEIPEFKDNISESIIKSKKKDVSSYSIRKKLFHHYTDDDMSDYDGDNVPRKSISDSPHLLHALRETKFQERSSPKFKALNLKDIEVCSTPEISPYKPKEKLIFSFESNHIYDFNNATEMASTTPKNISTSNKFNNNTIKNLSKSNHDMVVNSPNLSPIKENLLNLSPIKEDLSMNEVNNNEMNENCNIL